MATKHIDSGIPDDENPVYIFSMTHTSLLVKAANGEIDIKELAKQQLRQRGLNMSGTWVGFKQAMREE
jgi:hypothetical protein